MKNVKRTQRNSGLTMIELVVALGVSSVLMMIVWQFYLDQVSLINKTSALIDFKADALLADKLILKDFRNAGPSINQLRIIDDNGENFFDYEATEFGALYKASPHKFRSITLNAGNAGTKRLYLAIIDPMKGSSVFVDPIVAYDVGASSPTDPNAPASLTYVGLNRDQFLATKNPRLMVQSPRGLVFVDSSGLMPVTANNLALRSAAFMGFPDSNGNLLLPSFPDNIFQSEIFSKDDANAEVKVIPNSFDQFLRELPPSGSGGSNLRISGVKLVKYELVCSTEGSCNLERSDWTGTAYDKNIRIISGISSVSFQRASINNTITSVIYTQHTP